MYDQGNYDNMREGVSHTDWTAKINHCDRVDGMYEQISYRVLSPEEKYISDENYTIKKVCKKMTPGVTGLNARINQNFYKKHSLAKIQRMCSF